jgi:aspartate aminotransferase
MSARDTHLTGTSAPDLLLPVLRDAGCRMIEPEGTFYLWGRWPDRSDPRRIVDALADRDVFVMPGDILNAPLYFRVSLTASDEMVRRALPIIAETLR